LQSELLEEEVTDLVGPKGKWNPDRTAVRHGHEDGEVTLGGRRVAVKRPRARTADGESEVHFADRDQLGAVVLERIGSTGARRNRSARRCRLRSARRRSRRCPARSWSAPARRCGG
jgi:hypothetical protein